MTWKTLTSSSPRTTPDSLHLMAHSVEPKPLYLNNEEQDSLEEEAETALHSTGKILKGGSFKGWEEGGNATAYGGMCLLIGSSSELDDQQ